MGAYKNIYDRTFYENIQQLKAVNFFAYGYILVFDMVLNTHLQCLLCKCIQMLGIIDIV